MGKCCYQDARILRQKERRNDVLGIQRMRADLSRNHLTPESGWFWLVETAANSFFAERKVEQELAEVDDGKYPKNPLHSNVFDHESHEEWACRGTNRGHQGPPA